MLPLELKRELFASLEKDSSFVNLAGDGRDRLDFLSKIWPLRDMPSKDTRFKNAYDDAFQHLVNNYDWDIQETFLHQLELDTGKEEYFIKFLETIVHPENTRNLQTINNYVLTINDHLRRSDVLLVITGYYDELPIYNVRDKSQDNQRPNHILHNSIPFFKDYQQIHQFPCFLLAYDKWNDFGYTTQFDLRYYVSLQNYHSIGLVKIMKRGQKVTWDSLDDQFLHLNTPYCSLGQSLSYYQELKDKFPDTFQSILLALQDAAFFTKIHELFEKDPIFKTSLLRGNQAEAALRTARSELEGVSRPTYAFNYIFAPPFGNRDGGDSTNLYFNFDKNPDFPQRIVALIGKNGTGKTSILRNIIEELRVRPPANISPQNLSFGKYFTVSISPFDRFELPVANADFNYVYCGLRREANVLKTMDERQTELLEAAGKIEERELIPQWYRTLYLFLDEEHLDDIFPDRLTRGLPELLVYSPAGLQKVLSLGSSGETILLFVITKIVSEIRDNSLIMYDEPENHLHPNAISDLMCSLSTLLDEFQSFCIMATHSPLVVRELTASQVIVLTRTGEGLDARPLSIDSFGENLTVITEDIFGNKDFNKLFIERLKKLIAQEKNFDNVIRSLKTGDIPVSLSTRLYIKTLIDEIEKPDQIQ